MGVKINRLDFFRDIRIPKNWIDVLAKQEEIWNLAGKLNQRFNTNLPR